MKKKVKIGVLINSPEIFLWEYRILEKLFNTDFSEINLLIIDKNHYKEINNLSYFFLRFYERFDGILYRNKFDYDNKINITNLKQHIPTYFIKSVKKETDHHTFENEIKGLLKYNLDIILNFEFKILRREYLKLSKFGIWTYKTKNIDLSNGFLAGYCEFIKRNQQEGYLIQNIHNSTDEIVIFQAGIPTRNSNSINKNKNCIYNLASLVIPRIIKGLFKFGDSYINYLTSKYNIRKEIKNIEYNESKFFVKSFACLSKVWLKYYFKKLFYSGNEYSLFYNINKDLSSQPFDGYFTELKAPNNAFWADPFVVIHNNHYYIFIEEFSYRAKKGHLSVLDLNSKGYLCSCEKIIEKSYHISFPFILEFSNSYIMIPETKADKTIQLYKCTQFPYKWEYVMNLMENVSAVDSTLFFHNDLWWLFTSIDQMCNPDFYYFELFLFYSDNLFSGKWTSHPQNPIVTDPRIARSAGKIFFNKDKIFRPSQDCSGLYGQAFNISQITKLSETEYQENLVSRVEPRWKKALKGTHTFNFEKDLVIIDGYSFRKRINLNIFNNWRLNKHEVTNKNNKAYYINISI